MRFYWLLMDMCLPVFDLYRDTVAPNRFKSHTNSYCSDFFLKKRVLSDNNNDNNNNNNNNNSFIHTERGFTKSFVI